MKFLSFIFSLLCLSLSMAAAPVVTSSDEEPDRIELEKDKSDDFIEIRPRSVLPLVEAFCYLDSGVVSVCHEGLGICRICLFDSMGSLIEYKEIFSVNYSVEQLNLPSFPGVYTLIIDSDELYASGVITVNQ